MQDIVISIEGPGGPKEVMRIPAAEITATKNAFLKSNPIPMIPDPDWVDPQDGSVAPMINKFGPMKWFIMQMQGWFLTQISRGLLQDSADNAKNIFTDLKDRGVFKIDNDEED